MERLFDLDVQLVNDVVLLAIAVFFLFLIMSNKLFNPARKLLQDRKDGIARDIADAKKDKEEAAAIIARANEEAELEKKKVADEVKQEMISVAAVMASKVVAANIDTTIQNTLVEQTLKEMGENTWLN